MSSVDNSVDKSTKYAHFANIAMIINVHNYITSNLHRTNALKIFVHSIQFFTKSNVYMCKLSIDSTVQMWITFLAPLKNLGFMRAIGS